MLRYALRRLLWAFPTLFGISLVVFFITSLLPDPAADLPKRAAKLVVQDPDAYDVLEEARRVRFLDLPAFFDPNPKDVRSRALQAAAHVIADDSSAALGRHELAKLGGAALPYLLPGLDKLGTAGRARLAVALAPIAERMGAEGTGAERMGIETKEDLHDPAGAVVFWNHFWEDRALDFTEPALQRAVHRLTIRASYDRERDLLLVNTFALSAVIPAMLETDDREALTALCSLASHVTGRSGRIAFDADDDALRHVVSGWQAWWQVHESDYVFYDGEARVLQTVLATRYGKWIFGAATGKLGTSAIDGRPIAEKLRAKTPVTLLLTMLALLASYVIAVPLGAATAWWRGRPVDVALAVLLFAMYSLPTFWAAQLLAHAFAVVKHTAPLAPLPLRPSADTYRRLAAPVVALMVGSLAILSRYQRSATLETSRQDYVRTAKAKGASPLRQLVVHALRNAMLPTVTLAGLQFPTLLGGAFVVEEVFGVPGIGYETIRAVEAHDTAWLVSIALLTAIVTILALAASDVAYGFLDPRIREAARGPREGAA